jgi:hypothetical protein
MPHTAAFQARLEAEARHERTLEGVALQAVYRYTVLLSVILCTPGR